MKINGQLEVAQFEVLSSEPALQPRGRVIFDKGAATPSVKVFDGTSWKALAYAASSSSAWYNAGNSSSAITIDWNNGAKQRLTLTANCLISFTNQSDGGEYTLLVENVSTSMYSYYFNIGGQDAQSNPIFPIWMNYGETRTHRFLYRSTTPTANNVPVQSDNSAYTYTAGASSGQCIDIVEISGGDFMWLYAGTTGAANNVNYYQARRHYGRISWGNKTAQTYIAAATQSIKVSPSKAYLATGSAGSPYLYVSTIYGPTAGQTYANPGTLPAGATSSIDWHPSERAIAVAHTTTPFLTAYPFSAAGYGTKYTNPVTLPASAGLSVAFSPFGDYIAVTHATTPFISVYPFDVVTGFGTKAADPSPLPAAPSVTFPRAVAWSQDGTHILMATATTPFIYVIPFNRSTGTFGTPLAAPAVNIPASAIYSIAFSKDNQWVFLGGSSTANIYPWSSTTGVTWASPVTFSFPAYAYYDAVWSNYEARLYWISSTIGSPQTLSLGYYAKNWIRTMDS